MQLTELQVFEGRSLMQNHSTETIGIYRRNKTEGVSKVSKVFKHNMVMNSIGSFREISVKNVHLIVNIEMWLKSCQEASKIFKRYTLC